MITIDTLNIYVWYAIREQKKSGILEEKTTNPISLLWTRLNACVLYGITLEYCTVSFSPKSSPFSHQSSLPKKQHSLNIQGNTAVVGELDGHGFQAGAEPTRSDPESAKRNRQSNPLVYRPPEHVDS